MVVATTRRLNVHLDASHRVPDIKISLQHKRSFYRYLAITALFGLGNAFFPRTRGYWMEVWKLEGCSDRTGRVELTGS